jgi:IS5 family transposase
MKIPGEKTGRYVVDSTKMEVCHNLRINRHKVFKELAKRGKTSTGWFFGFKLHVVINHKGELMSFKITTGNTDDRAVVEKLMQGLDGWLFGDKGYISAKLSENLASKGIDLITNVRSNMKKQFIEPIKKWWLGKRRVVETVIGQLKEILHIQHTRHRSPANFLANLLAGLLAYVIKPKKPSVSFAGSITKAAGKATQAQLVISS